MTPEQDAGLIRRARRALRPVKAVGRAVVQAGRVNLPHLLGPLGFSWPVTVDGARFRTPIARGVDLPSGDDHERWMSDLLGKLLPESGGSGLIDVGVNLGQTLLKAKRINRDLSYHGFEPNPFCVLYVEQLITLNAFAGCNVYPAALSDAQGVLDFIAASEADPAGSMLADFRPGKQSFRRRHVAALAFDELQLDLGHCKLVKIDVEGAELHVLRGMRRFLGAVRPIVICEVLHAHSDAKLADLRLRNDEISSLLRSLGYSVRRLRKDWDRIVGLEPVDTLPDRVWDAKSSSECDYLFIPAERQVDVVAAMA